MNTGYPCYSDFFGFSSSRTELRICHDEVVGSIPTSSTNSLRHPFNYLKISAVDSHSSTLRNSCIKKSAVTHCDFDSGQLNQVFPDIEISQFRSESTAVV